MKWLHEKCPHQLSCVVVFAALVGCGERPSTTASPQADGPSEAGMKFLLAEEPPGAENVIQVREQAQHNGDVLVDGRIGGSADPWVKGRAAFSIVDPTLKACSDIPGDMCEKPWDFCCEPNLAAATLLVKMVDEQGKLITTDARELLGVKELSRVVVKGKAARDDSGNLTILANGVHIRN